MIVQIREEGSKNNIWFYDVVRVENDEGLLRIFKGSKGNEYCAYESWVDRLVYYVVL